MRRGLEVVALPGGLCSCSSLSLRGIGPKTKDNGKCKGSGQECPLHIFCSTVSDPHGGRGVYEFGVGRICLPFLVARILRRGMGQGAAEVGRRTGVGAVRKSRFLDFGDDSLSRIIPLRSE